MDTEEADKSMCVLPSSHSMNEFRHSIPIMFKAYDGGKLTETLEQGKAQQVMIS